MKVVEFMLMTGYVLSLFTFSFKVANSLQDSRFGASFTPNFCDEKTSLCIYSTIYDST